MKQWLKRSAILLALFTLVLQIGPIGLANSENITTTPTGYTQAKDVTYVIVNGTVVNWGARGETCSFLTTYAEDYYTDIYSFENLSALDGGTGTSDAPSSQLYGVLQAMMQEKHTNLQGYQDTRPYYMYTDCVANDYSLISSFYSGNTVGSTWNGTSYNREHVWPKSKCLYTDKTRDSADIMMLRATISSENSSRGNSAYGESSGYFDPGVSVRGDCARMVLYSYVRWGNTGKMWGNSGVIENLDILLKWMAEDPVDTWEMGRNDSVQSITGVRNVFVDYPELAWLLFGQKVPEDYTTPSGSTAEKLCTHERTQISNEVAPNCSEDGYTGDTYCSDCGEQLSTGKKIAATGEHNFSDWITVPGGGKESRCCSICQFEEYRDLPVCKHENTVTTEQIPPTCTQDGHTSTTLCTDCGCFTDVGEAIPATGHQHNELHDEKDATCTIDGYTGDTYCIDCGEKVANGTTIAATGHQNILQETGKSPTCAENGYTGDKRCTDCGEVVEIGSVIPATGEHDFDDWESTEDGTLRTCKVCGQTEWKEADGPFPIWPIVGIGAAVVILVACIILIQIRKKKK